MNANEKALAAALHKMLRMHNAMLEHTEVESTGYDAKTLKEMSEAPTQALETLKAAGYYSVSCSQSTKDSFKAKKPRNNQR